MTPETTVYLCLGSNQGDRRQMLAEALAHLSKKVKLAAVSSIYETDPVDYLKQPPFLNAACRISTKLGPHQLLTVCKGIESKMGRECGTHSLPRPIDIDILLYGDQVIESPTLTIPHARMQERAFVLVPLAEIAPEAVHPVEKQTIAQLAKKVGTKGVKKLE